METKKQTIWTLVIAICVVIFFASIMFPSKIEITINHTHKLANSKIDLRLEHDFTSYSRLKIDHDHNHRHSGIMWVHP